MPYYDRYAEIRRRLAAIQSRLSGLTPGRWEAHPGAVVTNDFNPKHIEDALYYGGGMVCESVGRIDAVMIANAPDDLRMLLSLCEGLLRERQRLDAAIPYVEARGSTAARVLLDIDLRTAGIELFTLNAGLLPRQERAS